MQDQEILWQFAIWNPPLLDHKVPMMPATTGDACIIIIIIIKCSSSAPGPTVANKI